MSSAIDLAHGQIGKLPQAIYPIGLQKTPKVIGCPVPLQYVISCLLPVEEEKEETGEESDDEEEEDEDDTEVKEENGVVVLTDGNFETFMEGKDTVLVEFYAPW